MSAHKQNDKIADYKGPENNMAGSLSSNQPLRYYDADTGEHEVNPFIEFSKMILTVASQMRKEASSEYDDIISSSACQKPARRFSSLNTTPITNEDPSLHSSAQLLKLPCPGEAHAAD